MPLALRTSALPSEELVEQEVPPSRWRRRTSTGVAEPKSSPPPALAVLGSSVLGGAELEPDMELVLALRSGRRGAAEALYARVERVVERVLVKVLERRGPDYADLFQETFERLLRSLAHGRFEGACSLGTWAGAIASHVALDAIRARSKSRRYVDVEELERSHVVDSSRVIEARAELSELLDALAAIRPERARAVYLFDVMGHSLPEVAQLTDVTVAAAQSRLVRGRKELLARLRSMG